MRPWKKLKINHAITCPFRNLSFKFGESSPIFHEDIVFFKRSKLPVISRGPRGDFQIYGGDCMKESY